MTVQSQTSRADYTGNGATVTFSVPFYFLDATHLQVLSTVGTTTTTLVLNSDYTVSGAGNPAGGSITCTVAPAGGTKLSILRNVPLTQLTHYVPNDDFPAASHEQALDKLTMEVQQIGEAQGRALTLPPSSTGVSTTLPIPIANNLIGWDAGGDALQNIDPTTLASIVAFGTAKVDLFSGDGSAKDFTLSANPANLANLDVSIGGVDQRAGIDYTWTSGTTLHFIAAPLAGTNNIQVKYKQALPQGVADGASTTFLQAGTGALPRTMQDKAREMYDLEDYAPVDKTGVTECTTTVVNAALYAAQIGKGLRLPAGTLLVDVFALAAALPELAGRGKTATTLKFKRRTYSAGQILMDVTASTARLRVADLTLDMDDPVFRTAGTYAAVANGTTGVTFERCLFKGAGAAMAYASNSTGFTVRGCDFVGSSGGFDVGVSVSGTSYNGSFTWNTFTGTHTVGVTASGGWGHNIDHNYSVGSTGTNFVFYLAACRQSHVDDNVVIDSQFESIHIRNTIGCTASRNLLYWGTAGQDMGMSIGGDTAGSSGFNVIESNVIINAYAAGIGVGDNTRGNLTTKNILVNCGVRGTAAAGSGTNLTSLAAYTLVASSVCTSNTFSHNTIYNEGTAVTYAVLEANGGAGSTISSNRWLDNDIYGTFTNRASVGATAIVADYVWQSFTPTISPASGAIASYTVNSAQFRRRGSSVEMTLDISITNAGTGAGALTILFGASVPNAATNAGVLCGREGSVSTKMCAGVCNSVGLVVVHADGTTVIATGARVVMSGSYRSA